MIIKYAFYATTATGIAAVLIPPFGRKLDKNVLLPIRRYNELLNQEFTFKTRVYIFLIG